MTTHNDVTEAHHAIQHGHVIIYPTDTLYALGADPTNTTALHTLFSLKHRTPDIPLPVAVHSLTAIDHIATLTPTARRLADRFLPGPLTLILHKKPLLPDLLTAGQPTIAIRIPNDPTALQLLHLTGPLTATSANLHNQPTPATVPEILQQLHASALHAIDRGPRNQTASTIIDLTTTPPQILRHGTIPDHTILEALHG